MIWFWLRAAWRNFAWLWITPKPSDVARIRNDGRCPVCGFRGNRLTTVHLPTAEAVNGVPQLGVFCRHECKECGARWFEKPIAEVTTKLVHEAKA